MCSFYRIIIILIIIISNISIMMMMMMVHAAEGFPGGRAAGPLCLANLTGALETAVSRDLKNVSPGCQSPDLATPKQQFSHERKALFVTIPKPPVCKTPVKGMPPGARRARAAGGRAAPAAPGRGSFL